MNENLIEENEDYRDKPVDPNDMTMKRIVHKPKDQWDQLMQALSCSHYDSARMLQLIKRWVVKDGELMMNHLQKLHEEEVLKILEGN